MLHLQTSAVVLLLVAPAVLSRPDCRTPVYGFCTGEPDWRIGLDHIKRGGTLVHGHANFPVNQSPSGNTQGTLHGSHVFGGPNNGAQTVGGGLNYQHNNGLHGKVDVTHTRGQGNTVSAGVGGSTKLGPGTLTVGGGATKHPGSSHIQGEVGATYTIPLP